MEHDTMRCFTCGGIDHITGNQRCPALGTPRKIDLYEENAQIDDPTTTGRQQHPTNPSHRGAKALQQNHQQAPAIVVIPKSPPSAPTRTRTPSSRRVVSPQGSPSATRTSPLSWPHLQVPSSPKTPN